MSYRSRRAVTKDGRRKVLGLQTTLNRFLLDQEHSLDHAWENCERRTNAAHS